MAGQCENSDINKLIIEKADCSEIIKFYKGKSIFITGATGFLGMALVEKLVFSCSGIKNIYLLIKPKRNKSIEERLEDMKNSNAFKRVRDQVPNALKKIKAVNGNLINKNLGISEADIKTISQEVSIVFHLAASLNFQQTIPDAVRQNTMPTEELCKLCKKFTQLEVFVYASTAYSNCNREIVLEEVYKSTLDSKTFDYLCNEIDDNHPNKIFMAEGRPNAYSYSKHLAECSVDKYSKEFTTVIVRPSVVTASTLEPYPGWQSGWNGTNSVIAGMSAGLLRCWAGVPDNVADLIPVDICNNLLIASAWDSQRNRDVIAVKKTKVFNCCSGLQNPITVGTFMRTCLYHSKLHFKERIMMPSLILTNNKYLLPVLWFLLCTVPAYLIDGINKIFGKNARMMKSISKLKNLQDVLEYFSSNQFLFVDYNVKRLFQSMSEFDQNIFNFDIKSLDWNVYLRDYVIVIDQLMKNK